MSLRIITVVMLAFVVSACVLGSPKRTDLSAAGWYKEGVSDEQRYEEVRYCRRSADREAAHDYGYAQDEGRRDHNDTSRTYRREVGTYQSKRYRRDLFDDCLSRYGYVRGAPKSRSESTPK